MIKTAGALNQIQAPILRSEVLTDDLTIVIGDSVKMVAGFIALGTAGAGVFGHVTSIVTPDEFAPIDNGAGEIFTTTYTATADNETVAGVSAKVDISTETFYSAELDAAVGTTPNSNLSQFNFDLIDANTLDESTVTALTAQYNSFGIDPTDDTKVLVHILESQVYGA